MNRSWVSLIRATALLASGRLEELSAEFDSGVADGVKPRDIYEIILQCYLFLGYPKAIEGLKRFRGHFGKFEHEKYTDDPAGSVRKSWASRGEELCRTVYGKNYEALRRAMRAVSPELDSWMIWEGYGKVLSRPGPSPALREICTCSALIVTGDFVQLNSHMRGAIHTGVSIEELAETIEMLDGIASGDNRERALTILQEIAGKGE